MLKAITREVSPGINGCELSFPARQPIDVPRAVEQHKAYESYLRELGVQIVSLPAEPDLPDSVFVEDAALVTEEFAVITRPGRPSRQPETATIADALSRYRPLKFMTEPATLDGGDVMSIGKTLFVGRSARTNDVAIAQLRDLLRPHSYDVKPVEVRGCLHLKTGCSYIGNNTILVNDPASTRACSTASTCWTFRMTNPPPPMHC